jgi:hypothetical protein
MKSVYATSRLMHLLRFLAPRLSGKMYCSTISTHLVCHIHEDIKSFFAESGHITICKDTTRNTQKRSQTFTVQAAMRYEENLAIHQASTAIKETIGCTDSPTEIHVAKLKWNCLSFTRTPMVTPVVIVSAQVRNYMIV